MDRGAEAAAYGARLPSAEQARDAESTREHGLPSVLVLCEASFITIPRFRIGHDGLRKGRAA